MSGLLMRVAVAAATMLAISAPAAAGVLIKVDLARQRMTVEVDGRRSHDWAVSSARPDFVTPTGTYRPQRMHRMWYSRKYDMAPMPHAIFYSGGYAIHGTTSIGLLGRPASHGCIRLAPANAATLFTLVQRKGMAATRIVIHGVPPKVSRPAVARRGGQPMLARMAEAQRAEPNLFSALFGPSQPVAAPPRPVPIAISPRQTRSEVRPLPLRTR